MNEWTQNLWTHFQTRNRLHPRLELFPFAFLPPRRSVKRRSRLPCAAASSRSRSALRISAARPPFPLPTSKENGCEIGTSLSLVPRLSFVFRARKTRGSHDAHTRVWGCDWPSVDGEGLNQSQRGSLSRTEAYLPSTACVFLIYTGLLCLFPFLFAANRRQWFVVVVTEHGMNQTHFS